MPDTTVYSMRTASNAMTIVHHRVTCAADDLAIAPECAFAGEVVAGPLPPVLVGPLPLVLLAELLPFVLLSSSAGSASWSRVVRLRCTFLKAEEHSQHTRAKCAPTTGLAMKVSGLPVSVEYRSPKGHALWRSMTYAHTTEIKASRVEDEVMKAAVNSSHPDLKLEINTREDNHNTEYPPVNVSALL